MKLHDYQEVSVAHLQANPRAVLMLDMGLGKTASVLSALRPEHLPVLVTAPKRVAEFVWPDEMKTWRPDLTYAVAAGRPADRQKALGSGADVIILGRDNLADAIPYSSRFNTFVIDELSGFKSRTSDRFKSAVKVIQTGGIYHVWGMTGTPAPNGLLDLWAQMCLIDGGVRLGTKLTTYRKDYFTAGRQLANGVVTEWNLIPGAAEEIHGLLDDICLGMTSDTRLDLPDMLENDVIVPMDSATRTLYRDMKRHNVANFKGEEFFANGAAAASNKLAQITGGFIYKNDAEDITARGDGSYAVIHQNKIRALQEIIDGTGSPVLVFYRYQAERDLIIKALGKSAYTVDTPDLQARWNAGELPVLVAHPDSIGHGLNLQKGPGHTMVWYSLPWSWEAYAQSNKRLQRQGQKNVVVQHRLMTPRSTDFAVLAALQEKRSVESALMAHLESPL